MSKPLITVVIPTNRRSPFLVETVSSVYKQSLGDWELVIVADGAGAEVPVDLPRDDRTRIARQPHRGLSAARNLGVLDAHGKYIAFLDDDDRWLPGKLEAQAAAMEASDEIGLCHTQFRYIDELGHSFAPGWAHDLSYAGMLGGAWGISTSATMYRKDTYWLVGGSDVGLEMTADLDLELKVAMLSETVFIDEVLSEYRVHRSGMSRSRVPQYLDARSVFAKHRRRAARVGNVEQVALADRGLTDLRRHYVTRLLASAGGCVRGGDAIGAAHAAIGAMAIGIGWWR